MSRYVVIPYPNTPTILCKPGHLLARTTVQVITANGEVWLSDDLTTLVHLGPDGFPSGGRILTQSSGEVLDWSNRYLYGTCIDEPVEVDVSFNTDPMLSYSSCKLYSDPLVTTPLVDTPFTSAANRLQQFLGKHLVPYWR